jgi:hypothetical protein
MKNAFSNSESAINAIIESSKRHSDATDIGDYKTANKNYNVIQKAVTYLRENDGLSELKNLLTNDEISVKVWVATFLLKHYEQDAVTVLEDVAKKSIPQHSFNAKMVLQEWRNGRLNM